MFFNTYQHVNQYCAGCRVHDSIIDEASKRFPLKKQVASPLAAVTPEIMRIYPRRETIIISKDTSSVVRDMLRDGVNIIVTEKSIFSYFDSHDSLESHVCIVFNRTDLNNISNQRNNFFLSGTLLVIYPDDDRKYDYIKTVLKVKKKFESLKIVHLLKEDIFLENNQKYYSDYLDAPIIRLMD